MWDCTPRIVRKQNKLRNAFQSESLLKLSENSLSLCHVKR